MKMTNFKAFIAVVLCMIFAIIWLWIIPVYAAEPKLPVGNYYFTADWCPGCKVQSKVIKSLEKQGYKFTVYDADKDPDIFKNLDIKTIPTIIIVKSKDVILKLKGEQPVRKLIKLLVKELTDGEEEVDQGSN